MILGFTGTRQQPTEKQLDWLGSYLRGSGDDDYIDAFHHGACVGADEAAHDMVVADFDMTIFVHPPTDERLMMPKSKWFVRSGIHVLGAKPYHDRNRDIVDACDGLIALPKAIAKPKGIWGGGTRFTIDYARSIGKPVWICYADGIVA